MKTTTQTRMRAATRHGYGAPRQVIETSRIDRPEPAAGEVLVRVHAAGASIGDWLMVEGLPHVARPSYGLFGPKQQVPGQEMSGRVEAVGDAVTEFRPGDEVFGFASGAFAEYVVARPAQLARKPAHLSFEEAAALPVSGVAAHQALGGGGGLVSGRRVLVIGASGAVGSLAVQIAKAHGAEVTGVASTRNVELVRSLGADFVIDYTRERVDDGGRRYDLIVDLAGNRALGALRSALAPEGTLVIVGGSGGRWLMGFGRTLRAMALAPFVRQRLRPLFSQPDPGDLEAIRGLAESRALAPVIGAVHPLEAVAEALERIAQRRTAGKTVITV